METKSEDLPNFVLKTRLLYVKKSIFINERSVLCLHLLGATQNHCASFKTRLNAVS